MSKSEKRIFLTGVTGALGREILKELLTTTNDFLFLLARPKNRLSAENRLKKILESSGLDSFYLSRLKIFEGDVTSPNLGLSEVARQELASQVDLIFHIAALTALNGSREDCERINLKGTEEVLKFANLCRRSGKLKRFFYFSTAYAAGSLQTHCSLEDELPAEPAHANHYEASKYAAEKKVREAMKEGLPATIFRPSIVVGDSKNGAVSEFNVIYPFMKLFAHGIIKKLPTRLDHTFNIVPIDFVVKASLAIAQQDSSIGRTFHLVSKLPPSIGTLLQVKEQEYPQMPHIEIIDPTSFQPSQLNPQERFVYEMLRPYLGYLNDHLTFDTRNTDEALKNTNVEIPKTDYDFLSKLTRYAVDAGYILA